MNNSLLDQNAPLIDWSVSAAAMPELVLVTIGVGLVLLDLFAPREHRLLPWLTVLGVGAVLFMNVGMNLPSGPTSMLAHDGYAAVFGSICLGSVILAALMREMYAEQVGSRPGEFYILLVFVAAGMLIMCAAVDLMCVYLGLELMALPIYVLVGMRKQERRTSEAAAKYFLMGVFASAMLLFGMSLLFGLTGTTQIQAIGKYIANHSLVQSPALTVALALMLAGLCFKVAVVPFHMWTPDVYEGAPTVLTAFMSVGPKAAGFAIFGRIMLAVFPEAHASWGPVLAILAVLTMAVGNIVALAQTSMKRMLAYSAIAHAGYALLGLAAGTAQGMAATMSYLFIYLFMNMGAFAVLLILARGKQDCEGIDTCKGLASRNPILALCMLVFMFSLTGIPPTGGFTGKFYLFQSALAAGYTPAVIAAVLLSAVSAFFYLRIVRLMYMDSADGAAALSRPTLGVAVALGIAVAGTLYLGFAPGELFSWTGHALQP